MSRARLLFLIALISILAPSAVFASGGVLYVNPGSGSYTVGDIFTAQVLVDTGGTSISAAEARLTFDTSTLEVERISTDGSICGSWASPPKFSNVSGVISFTGWTKTPYQGGSGLLLTITFKALKSSSANARFAAGAILATNGGSNIITSMESAAYTITTSSDIKATDQNTTDSAPPITASATDTTAQASSRSTSERNPRITAHDATVTVGEPIVLRGTGSIDGTFKVSIEDEAGSMQNDTTSTGADGSFAYISPRTIHTGVFRIWVTELFGAAEGSPSETVTVRVVQSGFAAEIGLISGIAIDLAPYTVLAALVGIGSAYIRNKRLVRK